MKRGGTMTGAVSLVMIFCVLCMAVFAVLTLSTAVREQSLAELTAQRAAEYYEADLQATSIAAAVIAGEPVETTEVSYSFDPEGIEASYTVPAGGDLLLEVRLLLTGSTYEILTWRTVYAGDWTPDTSMNLFDVDVFF